MNDPIPRDVLAKFLPDKRTIIAFEGLQTATSVAADTLSVAQLLIFTPNLNIPQAKLLVANAQVDFDTSTPGQIKFNVLGADKLSTPRNIAITGDLTWDVDFDGSSDVSAVGSLSLTGVVADIYEFASFEVDEKGRILSATSNTAVASFNTRTGAVILTGGDVTTALGFTPTNDSVLPTFSAYRAVGSGNQSIPTGVFTKIQCDTKEWDVGACYDAVTNYRFRPLTAGKYLISGRVVLSFSGSVTGTALISLYKNGVELKRGSQQSLTSYSGAIELSIGWVVLANGTTDYFELFVNQGTGASQAALAGVEYTAFQATWSAP